MKKIADSPKILVDITPARIELKLAPHFCCNLDTPFASQYAAWLQNYAMHQPAPLPPLLLDHLTPFTQRILLKLLTIPFGATATYASIDPAARAVGGACNRNPYPLLIPCHRVVAKGSLGGFAFGLEVKKRLLFHEQNLNTN